MSHRDRRKNIIEGLKLFLETKKGRIANEELLIFFLCDKYGCSRRTAKEYIQIAKHGIIKEKRQANSKSR